VSGSLAMGLGFLLTFSSSFRKFLAFVGVEVALETLSCPAVAISHPYFLTVKGVPCAWLYEMDGLGKRGGWKVGLNSACHSSPFSNIYVRKPRPAGFLIFSFFIYLVRGVRKRDGNVFWEGIRAEEQHQKATG
jgi:hypothetical protein